MQVFSIAPVTVRATTWLLLLIPVAAIALGVGVMGAALLGLRSARFEISGDGLRLRGDLYGRLIPAAKLRTDSAARVDVSGDSALRPVRRTMGTGLPGYSAGWFRLANGSRALVYLTDRTRAVVVPTTEDYSVLVSPADPDQFLTALRSIGHR